MAGALETFAACAIRWSEFRWRPAPDVESILAGFLFYNPLFSLSATHNRYKNLQFTAYYLALPLTSSSATGKLNQLQSVTRA